MGECVVTDHSLTEPRMNKLCRSGRGREREHVRRMGNYLRLTDGFSEHPTVPQLFESGVGDDHINVTWNPGAYDEEKPKPVGNDHYVKYRRLGGNDWNSVHPDDGNFTIMLPDLVPGTKYEVVAVSVITDDDTGEALESESPAQVISTTGRGSVQSRYFCVKRKLKILLNLSIFEI